jgi:NAD(P)-dependent dehydrogenase (short-subunit alcohol dehydrogenase family)
MSEENQFSLEGKRALVTGAGRGLGLAIANGLAQAGARVALVSRSEDELRGAAESIGPAATAFPADVAVRGAAAPLLDEIEQSLDGGIDVVVHAAGVQHREPAESFDPDEWDRVISINLTAPFLLSQELGKRQLERGRGGSHIFIGSLSSQLSLPSVVAYTASKSGIYGVLRNLSLEWAGRGIRVNGLGPGYIRTKLTEAVFDDSERKERMLQRIPMNRFGEPEELAGAAVFLASNASSYITGQLLMVDGGWTAS